MNATDYEWSVVGSLFKAGAYAVHKIRKDGLRPDHFTSPALALAFQVLCDLADEHGAIDRPLFRRALTQQYADYGQAQLDMTAADVIAVVFREDWMGSTAPTHGAKVRDAALMRGLQYELSAALDETQNPKTTARELLTDINARISSLVVQPTQEAGRTSVLAPRVLADLKERYEKGVEVAGIPTGFPTIDRILDGLLPGTLHIIAGKTSSGKSTLTGNMACSIASKHKRPGVIFSLEMKREQLTQRYIFTEAQVNRQDIRNRNMDAEKWARLEAAAARVGSMPLIFEDNRRLSLPEMLGYLRLMRFQRECDFAVVDYTQLIRSSTKRRESREAEVAEIVSELGSIAMELEMPVLALSQLNDDGRTRESRSIENYAESLLVVEQMEDRKDPMVAEKDMVQAQVVVQKNRDGEVRNIPLMFYPRYTRFEEVDFGNY
jgi:replicative DNA helicase